MTLQYPYGVIDYESSGKDKNTYPIEIGIAIRTSKNSPVKSWGSLIKPCSTWLSRGEWNPEAEKIHNITREMLEQAPTVESVAAQAMQFAGDVPLYFDGGSFDLYWHERFTNACRSFHLNILTVSAILDMQEYLDILHKLEVAHRAEPDAIQNLEIIENLLAT